MVPLLDPGKKKYIPIPKPADERLRDELITELGLMSECYGEMVYGKEAYDYYCDWYMEHVDRGGLPPMFHGSKHRMATQALKLSMTYQAILSRKDIRGHCEIGLEATKMATDDIDYMYDGLVRLANQDVAFNSFDKEKHTVLRIVDDKDGNVGHSELLRLSRMKASSLNAIVDTLVEAGMLEAYREETDKGGTRKMYRRLENV